VAWQELGDEQRHAAKLLGYGPSQFAKRNASVTYFWDAQNSGLTEILPTFVRTAPLNCVTEQVRTGTSESNTAA
jgi:hypothetical protein